MAYFYIQGLGTLFVLWAIYTQTRYWLSWRALRKWGDHHGCKDAPSVPNKLPWGIERLYLLYSSINEIDFLEDFLRAREIAMGCHTYRIFGVFNSTILTTSDPANIQAILATKFTDYDLGPARRDNFFELLGNGIFTSDGEEWVHYRQQLKPQFSRDQVSDLRSAGRHLDILFNGLPEEDTKGWVQHVNVMPLFYRLTMDVSTEFLFGESVHSQTLALQAAESNNTAAVKDDMEFADAMTFAQEYIAWRSRLRSLYWLARSREFIQACQTIKDFASRFVRAALDPAEKRLSEGQSLKAQGRFVLLEELLEETRDPIELRDQMLHVLLAGRDTTSALLCWVILLLSRHEHEFTKLRAAVVAQFGSEMSPISEMTFSSLKACKEIQHVINESLRLYPLIPMNGRRALKDTVLPTGGGADHKAPIVVRKGEMVGFVPYVMHRRADIWGMDADEFRPERWEGRKLGWEFVPFSGGPRVCLGQQYALTLAAFVVARFLQRYDRIEAVNPDEKIVKGLTITLSPGNGVNIKLRRATE